MKATFKNCYGLEDFTLEEIKFDAHKSKAIIYAPNGVMKSSFSKTLDDISRKKKPSDRIFTENPASYTVEYYASTYTESKKLKKTDQPNIYVINSFDEKFEAYSDSVAMGEKRALYLLQVLFDLEKVKDIANKTGQKQLVVADDIADSFDYSNKYAIIEYLSELSENKMIDLLILTHNFDFYRTVTSRLDIKYDMCFIAQKNASGKITMSPFPYRKDFFNLGIINKIRNGSLGNDETKLRTFVAAIPFCRNICDYMYEPLIDIPDYQLIDLYKKCGDLGKA